jgi:hypothetical protein
VVHVMADNARRDVARSARQAEAGSARAIAEIARVGAACAETLAKTRTASDQATS